MNALTHQSAKTKAKNIEPSIEGFKVGAGANFLSGVFAKHPNFWKRAAAWETKVLGDQLESIEIKQPVYVTGLARSGTTLLLEILAGHSNVATHQYRDFPALFIPYWWGKSQSNSAATPTERAHGDKMMVTPESPEAMEEMLWMSSFEDAHNPQVSQILCAETSNESFENLYRDHVRKLLFVRGRDRYVAKGNYNITRLAYLKKLFEDTRFVVAIRNPVAHIASLIKQHKLFTRGETAHPKSLTHMQRVGHFEFGLDVRPINTGNSEAIRSVIELWESGESVRGWARYWASIYGWLNQYLKQNSQINQSTTIVRYEDLCGSTPDTLQQVLEFSGLTDETLLKEWENKISVPAYYKPDFSEHDLAIIEEEAGAVAGNFGY